MPDIFDEVEEDLRAERARALGRRYAWLGVVTLILVLAGTGGYVAWQKARADAADAVAGRFITAAKAADHAATPSGATDKSAVAETEGTLFDIAANGPAGYAVLARLRLAALQWQAGQHPQAIASWQAVSDDQAAPALLRDLATLTSAQRQVDAGDPTLLRQRLESLTAESNPWRPMAEQTIALLDLRIGRARDAAGRLRRLTLDPQAPEGVREMATDLLTTLPADTIAEPAQAPSRVAPQAASPLRLHAPPSNASPSNG